MATHQAGIGGGVNAAGVQLTGRDTNCAGLRLQRVGLMFKGMRQGIALRGDQQYYQQQIWREPGFSANANHGMQGNPIGTALLSASQLISISI